MFTGIIDHTGTVLSITQSLNGLRFAISTQFNDLHLGESISVDGVCLTVTDFSSRAFSCDVSPETLALTRCGDYHEGSVVNLERSLRLCDRLGGHYVTGHVDQTAVIKNIIARADYIEMILTKFDQTKAPYLVSKGSITVNGVSLTINSVSVTPTPEVSLMLIPHTLDITNLKNCVFGSAVNIEFDYYAKTIAHQLGLYLKTEELVHVS